jgi:Zn-dependent peptidase ImmA (M78 family)/ribosome-binding protein aMBF1 (putative translation factor)
MRNNMPAQFDPSNKDSVLSAFLESCPSPTSAEIVEWQTKFPQHSTEIEKFAAILRFLDGDGELQATPEPTAAEMERAYQQSVSSMRSIEQKVRRRNKGHGLSHKPDDLWQETFGSRLEAAREAKNLGQDALAAKINPKAPGEWILEIEQNAYLPDIETITALARCLAISASYLVNADELRLVDLRPRNAHKLTSAQLRGAEIRALDFAHRYLDLEARLDETPPELINIPIQTPEEAEDAARRVRSLWNLREAPVASITSVFEDNGIKILPLDLPKGDGAALRIDENGQPKTQIIAYVSDLAVDRTRFTLAHELAHLLDPEVPEDMANHFAAAFLLPANILRSRFAGGDRKIGVEQIISIKHEYGISAQAITYRCRDIGLGDAESLAALRRSFDNEKDNYPSADLSGFAEKPQRFEVLKARARQITGQG